MFVGLQAGLEINARFRRGPQTGVQRVPAEILPRLGVAYEEIAPSSTASGIKGHAWEQFVLPIKAAGAPLWSPCNTGPLAARSQVVTIHDAAVFDHPEWFSRQFVTIYRLLLPRLARRSRRIVTVSEFSRRQLAAALDVPIGSIEVVYNGVSSQFAPVAPEEAAGIVSRYGVRPGRYFASLSTLEPRKNLALSLRAWAAARGSLPADIRLLLIGGKGKSEIFGQADPTGEAQQDGVTRTGFVPDAELPALLSGAIGLLYPSHYEGFGLPVLEAMACGTPVVTVNRSSLPEVGGTAALYVDPDDGAALADAIRKLAGDASLRSDLSAAGLAQANLFSWDDAAAKMRHILQRDLGV